jgi:trehalose 6-phosphate phosphatase
MASYYQLIGFTSEMAEAATEIPDLPALDRTAFVFGFDGTLVDIAERPDAISVQANLEDLLLGLNARTGGAVTVISERALADLERRLPRFDGTLIGSHGAERRQNGERHFASETRDDRLEEFRDIVRTWASHHPSVLVEEKPASVALHFRRAPDLQPECVRLLHALTESHDDFVVSHGKMSVELLPARICKRYAVEEMLDGYPDRLPVVVGDDPTDEGMLALAVERGGYGIKVGFDDSQASHRVESVAEVHALMRRWLTGTPEKVTAAG